MGRLDLEGLADSVTEHVHTGDWSQSQRNAAVETLILSLSDDWLRQDADVEDAVCSALEAVGVMRRVGNLNFELVPEHELPDQDRAVLHRCGAWLPGRYQPHQS